MKKYAYIFLLIGAVVCNACSSQKKIEPDSNKAGNEQNVQKDNQENIQNDKQMTQVLISTSLGDITVALYDETPQHKANFIKLVKESYYDGTLFHRVIKGFMVQGGDPNSKTAKPGQPLGNGGPGYTVPAEFVPSLIHKRGAVAAARLGDQMNPTKASSGSQFYIVDGTVYDNAQLDMLQQRTGKTFTAEQRQAYSTIGGAPFLDGDYTVFGEVVKGMEVVDKIAAQEKDPRDRPVQDVKILKTTIIESK